MLKKLANQIRVPPRNGLSPLSPPSLPASSTFFLSTEGETQDHIQVRQACLY